MLANGKFIQIIKLIYKVNNRGQKRDLPSIIFMNNLPFNTVTIQKHLRQLEPRTLRR